MKKKLNKDDFDYFIGHKYDYLALRVERLEGELWAFRNPPKFKKGDIVIQANREFEILGFKEAVNRYTFDDRPIQYNTYCACDGNKCIDIDDTSYYPLKLKDGKETK